MAVIISATPALSSAPRREVPSVVMSVRPFNVERVGKSDTLRYSPVPSNRISPPS